MAETKNITPYQKINFFIAVIVCGLTASCGSFCGGLWGGIVIGGAIALCLAGVFFHRKILLPAPSILILTASVLGLFVLEIPWSSQPALSAQTWIKLATIFPPLSLLTSLKLQRDVDMPRLVPILAVISCVSATALGFELLSGGFLLHSLRGQGSALTEYNRGVAHSAILVFPLLAWAWETRKKNMLILFLLVLSLFFVADRAESHTAKLAVILGLTTVAAAFVAPRIVTCALAAGAMLLPLWPFAASWIFAHDRALYDAMRPSAQHRIEIWDYLSYRIMERPFAGWGLGTTRMLDFHSPHSAAYHYATGAAPHAHNMIVCLWVETGMAGVALGIGFLLIALRGARRLSPPLRPFALGCWVAALTVSLFGFDLWTDALWACFALAAFIFGGLQQATKPPP